MKQFKFFHSLCLAYSLLAIASSFGCSSAPKAPKDARSVNFAVTSEYLDLGGDVYAYMDVDGDVHKASLLANELISVIDEIPAHIKSRIDVPKMVKTLGLTDIQAIGMSSYALEGKKRFLNKSFVKTNQPRTGIYQYVGDQPHPLEILQLAPSDAVFAVESDINMTAVLEALLAVIYDASDAEYKQKLDKALSKPIAPGAITIREFIAQLDTKIMGAFVVDPIRTIPIPDTKIRIPYIDGFISIDNMGFAMDILVKEARKGPIFSVREDDTWQNIELLKVLPEDVFPYQPIIKYHKSTGRIYIATNTTFLEERLQKQHGLETDVTFLEMAAPLPMEAGNALLYISPKLVQMVKKTANNILAKESDLHSVQAAIDILAAHHSPGLLSVRQNTEDGIYQVTNAPFSHKFTLMGSLYLGQLYGLAMIGGASSYAAKSAMRDLLEVFEPKREEIAMPPYAEEEMKQYQDDVSPNEYEAPDAQNPPQQEK